LQVPAGVYFSGDFTVTAWIYLKSFQPNSRLFDFGNGAPSDNVLSSVFSSIYYHLYQSETGSNGVTSQEIINLNQWYYMAFVLSGTTGYIYVNGSQVASGASLVPNNIVRTSNYIGKSNWGNPNADAIYDEIKIYKGALSAAAINSSFYSELSSSSTTTSMIILFLM